MDGWDGQGQEWFEGGFHLVEVEWVRGGPVSTTMYLRKVDGGKVERDTSFHKTGRTRDERPRSILFYS